jgi:C_GCAxxG_C_C family probable redox protein
MTNADSAIDKFKKGLNCAQAVFSTFGPSCGLDEEMCVRIASPFGGGIGHLQEVCGAVSGAIMVIGLKHGAGSTERDVRDHINELAQNFVRDFKLRNNSVLCRDLLSFDITTKSGLAEARKKGVFAPCAGYVRNAVEILETML